MRLHNYTARLFYLSSVSGVFKSTEIRNPCRNLDGLCVSFPFRQADLYKLPQPGTIMGKLPGTPPWGGGGVVLCVMILGYICLFVNGVSAIKTTFPRRN